MSRLISFSLGIFLACFALGAFAADATSIKGQVTAIDPDYGNIDTDLTPDAVVSLKAKQGDTITIAHGDKHFSVYLGTTYSDVPKGDWVAFLTTTGNIRFARNYDNAAKALGVKTGDTIELYK